MKQETFVYFIGTAGSGKSTLTYSFQQWMNNRGLDAITVNLDPGAENLPYVPDVDIRDWISLKEIMDSYGLGPNGAQIAAADMLALNIDDFYQDSKLLYINEGKFHKARWVPLASSTCMRQESKALIY